MPHMVIFRTSEGKPGYHQTETLDEAIRFVEHLRNKENVPDARVFLLKEVPLEIKTYVKVEIAGSVADEARDNTEYATVAAPPPPPAPAPAPAPEQASVPASEPASAPTDGAAQVPPSPPQQGLTTARFGRFNRG